MNKLAAVAESRETPTSAINMPDTVVSAREAFGIDTDMEVPGFATRTEHVPDIDPAYRFDRVLVLDKGRLVGNGLPHEVLTAPLLREVFRVKATFVESLVPELPSE